MKRSKDTFKKYEKEIKSMNQVINTLVKEKKELAKGKTLR